MEGLPGWGGVVRVRVRASTGAGLWTPDSRVGLIGALLCMWARGLAGRACWRDRLSGRAGGSVTESCGLGSKSWILGSG